MSPNTTHIVADIGGTNARFALVDAGSTAIVTTLTLQVKDFGNLTSAFRHFVDELKIVPPRRACIALAGPIEGDHVRLTNGDWSFSIENTRTELGLEQLLLVNDFKAQASALPYFENEQLLLLGGQSPIAGRAKVIVGPGTGLGVAASVPSNGGYTIIQGEGGHMGLSPASDLEMAVHQLLLQQYGRVSAERILCGAGLRNLYLTLNKLQAEADGEKSEAQIVADAIDGTSANCRKALDLFLAYLGAVAGDLALTFGALGGVYIAGGIAPRLVEQIGKSDFRARFEQKGRLAHMVKDVPTYLVLSKHAGLIGAAACLNAADQ